MIFFFNCIILMISLLITKLNNKVDLVFQIILKGRFTYFLKFFSLFQLLVGMQIIFFYIERYFSIPSFYLLIASLFILKRSISISHHFLTNKKNRKLDSSQNSCMNQVKDYHEILIKYFIFEIINNFGCANQLISKISPSLLIFQDCYQKYHYLISNEFILAQKMMVSFIIIVKILACDDIALTILLCFYLIEVFENLNFSESQQKENLELKNEEKNLLQNFSLFQALSPLVVIDTLKWEAIKSNLLFNQMIQNFNLSTNIIYWDIIKNISKNQNKIKLIDILKKQLLKNEPFFIKSFFVSSLNKENEFYFDFIIMKLESNISNSKIAVIIQQKNQVSSFLISNKLLNNYSQLDLLSIHSLTILSRLKGSICLADYLDLKKEGTQITVQIKSDLQIIELFISNLIVLPKLRDHTLVLNISTFKLSLLLDNIPDIFGFEFGSKKILYYFNKSDIDSIIKIDYVLLRQILFNILIFFIHESRNCSLELIIKEISKENIVEFTISTSYPLADINKIQKICEISKKKVSFEILSLLNIPFNDLAGFTLLIASLLCRELGIFLQFKLSKSLNIICFSLVNVVNSLVTKNKSSNLKISKHLSCRKTNPNTISIKKFTQSNSEFDSSEECELIPNEDSKIESLRKENILEKNSDIHFNNQIVPHLNLQHKKKIEGKNSKFFACKIRNRPFILISDSDFVQCKSLRKMLKEIIECDIVTADNSERTLQSIKSLSVSNFSCYSKSLIFVDTKILNEDKDLIKQIRQFESLSKLNQITIVLLVYVCGYSIDQINKMRLQDNTLPKPVNLKELSIFLQNKNFQLKSNHI